MENNNQVKNSGKGKNIVIVFLILIILGLCGFIVYDKYVKDDVFNEVNTTTTTTEKEETTEEEVSSTVTLSGVYTGSYARNETFADSITLTFNTDNTVTLTSGDGAAVIESSKGTYEIKDNKLIYTRVYGYASDGTTLTMITPETNKTEASFGPDIENTDTTEEFIYNKENDTITTSTYFTKTRNRSENIILKK
jgi:cell division protein FtsL